MRRQFLLALLMITGAAGLAAADRRSGDQFDRGNRGYGDDYSGYSRQSSRANPVTAAMRDLEMIFRRARVDNHEANHFQRALRELAEFDQNAARGRFDRSSLDRAISNMADLAQARQLHPRDRRVIQLRTDDLRYFRSSGARF